MLNTSNSRIYMDYQASTPVDVRVRAAMEPYFFEKPGNPHASDHSFGWEASSAIERAAHQIAKSINADPDEVFFTSGATEANNLFILGAALNGRHGKKKRLLTTPIEHKSILDTIYQAADMFGYKVDLIPISHVGILNYTEFEKMIGKDVLFVSVISVNNEIGTKQDLTKISNICRENGALFHSDSVHLLPTDIIDVEKINIDAMSISAHKIYGPKGIGALYLKRKVQNLITPLFYGGGQQQGLRPGTLPVGLCVGLGEAVSLFDANSGIEERQRIRLQRDKFIARLIECGVKFQINGNCGILDHPGNINISFTGIDAHELLGILQPELAAATGSACTSGTIEASHVLLALGLTQRTAQSAIRFSIGRFTTDAEIERAISLISHAIKNILFS